MTVCSVYLGNFEDPKFKWEGGDWNGNVPAAISPDFPPMGEHYNAGFHRWVASSDDVECKKTDFAACVARVTKAQILDFISTGYAGKQDLPWIELPLKALNEFISTLDKSRLYALVATEWLLRVCRVAARQVPRQICSLMIDRKAFDGFQQGCSLSTKSACFGQWLSASSY